jgi:hypothetical protein
MDIFCQERPLISWGKYQYGFSELKINEDLFKCRVCGYNCAPFLPWGEDGKTPSYSICPRCGIEFGYEDSSENVILYARKKFLQNEKQHGNDQ